MRGLYSLIWQLGIPEPQKQVKSIVPRFFMRLPQVIRDKKLSLKIENCYEKYLFTNYRAS